MLIVTYIVSIIVFCIAAWVVPLLFAPIVWGYKAISKEAVILPTHLAYLTPYVLATVLLLYLARFIWATWGFDPGWLFPLLIAVIHLWMGGADGANKPNQAQAYGVVVGVMAYSYTSFVLDAIA